MDYPLFSTLPRHSPIHTNRTSKIKTRLDSYSLREFWLFTCHTEFCGCSFFPFWFHNWCSSLGCGANCTSAVRTRQRARAAVPILNGKEFKQKYTFWREAPFDRVKGRGFFDMEVEVLKWWRRKKSKIISVFSPLLCREFWLTGGETCLVYH